MTPSSAFMVFFFASAANADVANSRNSAALRILFTLPPRLGFDNTRAGTGLSVHHTTPACRTAKSRPAAVKAGDPEEWFRHPSQLVPRGGPDQLSASTRQARIRSL